MEYNYKYQESKEINNITRPEDIKDIPKYAELKTNPIYDEEGRIIEPAKYLDDPNSSYLFEDEQRRHRGR